MFAVTMAVRSKRAVDGRGRSRRGPLAMKVRVAIARRWQKWAL